MREGKRDALANLLDRFGRGERAALARAISMVEDERPGFQDLLHAVLADGLGAARVGLTGPPGAGKSTLAVALAAAYRERDDEVGIVAVDPTSPFSGGALLGDRIRMNRLATDTGVFIRSMATRGSSGGLATTTREAVDLMDAFGFSRVLVETVGVGQTELEIAAAADTVVVVLVPESGDAVQAMKAGLMEIADVFVVNKADRPGADRLVRDLRSSLDLRKPRDEDEASAPPRIPVVRTVATEGEGVDELVEVVDAHRDWLERSGELERRRGDRARTRIREVVDREVRRRIWSDADGLRMLDEGVERVMTGRETPYSVAGRLLDRVDEAGSDRATEEWPEGREEE